MCGHGPAAVYVSGQSVFDRSCAPAARLPQTCQTCGSQVYMAPPEGPAATPAAKLATSQLQEPPPRDAAVAAALLKAWTRDERKALVVGELFFGGSEAAAAASSLPDIKRPPVCSTAISALASPLGLPDFGPVAAPAPAATDDDAPAVCGRRAAPGQLIAALLLSQEVHTSAGAGEPTWRSGWQTHTRHSRGRLAPIRHPYPSPLRYTPPPTLPQLFALPPAALCCGSNSVSRAARDVCARLPSGAAGAWLSGGKPCGRLPARRLLPAHRQRCVDTRCLAVHRQSGYGCLLSTRTSITTRTCRGRLKTRSLLHTYLAHATVWARTRRH
jgi:hypothetical protein